jgi:transposase-like protein
LRGLRRYPGLLGNREYLGMVVCTGEGWHSGRRSVGTEHGLRSAHRLSPDERRAVILAALAPDANITAIGKEYGLHRNSVYELLQRAVADPKGKLREAEKEVAFRRRVTELVG